MFVVPATTITNIDLITEYSLSTAVRQQILQITDCSFRLRLEETRYICIIDTVCRRVASSKRIRGFAFRLWRVHVSMLKRPAGPAGLSFASMVGDKCYRIVLWLRDDLVKLVTRYYQVS